MTYHLLPLEESLLKIALPLQVECFRVTHFIDDSIHDEPEFLIGHNRPALYHDGRIGPSGDGVAHPVEKAFTLTHNHARVAPIFFRHVQVSSLQVAGYFPVKFPGHIATLCNSVDTWRLADRIK